MTQSSTDKDACLANQERPDLTYKHAWQWKWHIDGRWSDEAICINCGEERKMENTNQDGYTGKWRGEPIR